MMKGKVEAVQNREAKEALLEQNPFAQKIYSIDDPHFAVLCFRQAQANVYQSVGQIVTIPMV